MTSIAASKTVYPYPVRTFPQAAGAGVWCSFNDSCMYTSQNQGQRLIVSAPAHISM